jgi:hypothetical protein
MKTGLPQVTQNEWVEFPGGELEGRRPHAMCPECRDRLKRAASGLARSPLNRRPALCFQCYLADLERQRALKAAGSLDTASPERFQVGLPFEPVNHARLERLRAERAVARAELRTGEGRFLDRRRQAQIAARHALKRLAAGISLRGVSRAADGAQGSSAAHAEEARESGHGIPRELARVLADAAHAAELQLPDAWLPFVVAR